jgi:DNA-binding PadR family transcriptional regulator
MRLAKMLASGDLQLIILALLSEKPRYGYEIIKQIEEHSSGVYSPSPGMVYPALTYLEETGYAASESEGTKKLYKITEAGTAHLNKNRASVEETLDQLARFGKKMADFQKRYAEENEEPGETGSDTRSGIKAEWREARQEFRELRQDLKAAIMEKLEASPEERQRVFAILRGAIDEIRAKK